MLLMQLLFPSSSLRCQEHIKIFKARAKLALFIYPCFKNSVSNAKPTQFMGDQLAFQLRWFGLNRLYLYT